MVLILAVGATFVAALCVTASAQASAPGTVVSSEPANLVPPLAAATSAAYTIEYRSKTPSGQSTVVTGTVLIPDDEPGPGGYPVVSWGHGTVGASDNCVPSAHRDLSGDFGYEDVMIPVLQRLLAGGNVVAFTDYEGLGTPGGHPFLIADSEARGMIDIVKAAGHLDDDVSDTWAAMGHSQGGHAALAAGEEADSYGSGLDFRGTVAMAPVTLPSQYGTLAKLSSLAPFDHAYYLQILAGLKTQHSSLDYADLLGSQALAHLDVLDEDCITDTTYAFLGFDLPSSEFVPPLAADRIQLEAWLAANDLPRKISSGPIFVAQGDADYYVPLAEVEDAVDRLETGGDQVHFDVYEGVGHFDLLDEALDDTADWIEDQLD